MGQQVDVDLAAIELVGDRIDQERHVVVDDLRSKPKRSPSRSRRTASTGWASRWTLISRRLNSLAIESTRNGMSSLTICTMVWRLSQPGSGRAVTTPPLA